MPPWLLKQVEWGAVNTEEAPTPFPACFPFNPLLQPFLFLLIFVIQWIKVNLVIMVP
jgi:hypothetical protein